MPKSPSKDLIRCAESLDGQLGRLRIAEGEIRNTRIVMEEQLANLFLAALRVPKSVRPRGWAGGTYRFTGPAGAIRRVEQQAGQVAPILMTSASTQVHDPRGPDHLGDEAQAALACLNVRPQHIVLVVDFWSLRELLEGDDQ